MFVVIQNPKKRRHYTTKIRRGGTTRFIGTFDSLAEAIKMHRLALKYLEDKGAHKGKDE